jgi:SOS-response transcriptional repressor LexA
MVQSPTRAQMRVLRAIHDFQATHGYPPTVRQLAALLDMKSFGNTSTNLRRLQELGLLAERASNRECWRIMVGLAQALPPDRPEDVSTESRSRVNSARRNG